GRRDDAPGGPRKAEGLGLIDPVLVEGERGREAHALVVPGRLWIPLRRAEVEPLGRVADQADELEARRLLDLFTERTAQRVRDVDLASFEHRQACEILRHGLPYQALDRRGLAPVAIVRVQHELDPGVERRELVRAGADGRLLEALVTDLLDVLLGNDPARAAGRRAVERHEVGPRLLQAKAHAVGVDDLDSGDLLLQQTGGRALVSLERE